MAGKAGRRVGKLAARFVETAAKPGLYGDGAGLYLKVGDGGTKSWIYRFALNGKPEKMGLGAAHTISLAEARERAEAARKLVLDGINPRDARRAAKAAAAAADARKINFDEARDQFIKAHEAGWKSAKHGAQWRATLSTYASPIIGKLPVSEIDVGLVVRIIEPIWIKKNETAHRVRGRIEAILDWARVRGYRNGENPARWKGNLDHLLPKRSKVRKVQHHSSLPYPEIPAFMRDLRGMYGVAALALELAILTATRTSEVLGAQWPEFDLDDRIWTIPAERMKGGKLHRVPLSERAIAIVEDMATDKRGEFVFPGAKRGKPLSDMALLSVLGRMGRDDLTTHGFRSTFRTWTAERTNFQREIAEVALAHDVGDETEQAYQRGDLLDKRRRLMVAWAKYCEARPVAKAADVIALRP